MKKEEVEENSIAEIEKRIEELEKSANNKKKPKALIEELKRLKSTLHKIYIDYKRKIISYEENNYTTLVFLRSTNGFHKIFGHSLYFYTFDVAPKLDIIANVYSDGDREARSESGVVSIAKLEELEKKLKELKITKIKTDDKTGNLVVFKLPWKYTEKDITRFIEQNTYKKQRYNHVVIAENVIPTLYVNLNDLLKACYENVRRLEPVARETMGNLIVEVCAEMIRCYIEMGNGQIKEEVGLKHIRKLINKVKSQTKILSDLGLWNVKTYSRIGDIIIKTQDVVDKVLKNKE